MSQWTHVLGVIRYDSMAKCCYPVPWNKDEILEVEMKLVSNSYQTAIEPSGSEGGLQLGFTLTKRGPTIFVTGDLRDFGLDEIPSILKWVGDADTLVKENTTSMLFMRDCSINLDVEGNTYKYIIDIDPNGKLCLNSYR